MDNIELRSEKVRNIIGKIPPFLIRSGTGVIFLVFIGMIIGSYFFKYPETHTVNAELLGNSKASIFISPQINDKIDEVQQIIVYVPVSEQKQLELQAEIISISDTLTVKSDISGYNAQVKVIDMPEKIKISETASTQAEIFLNDKRLSHKLISFIKSSN